MLNGWLTVLRHAYAAVRVFCKTQQGANVYRAAIGSATTFVHVVTAKNYIRSKL
jgi:hypothetical protein